MNTLKSKKSLQTLSKKEPPAPLTPKGILLVDKDSGMSSFKIVSMLRKKTGVKKIGHAGTLDPFATGLMVMLIGKEYTKKSSDFLNSDKEYVATVLLGSATDTYDLDGKTTYTSSSIPTEEQVLLCLNSFQGEILQTPPMFSAKKIQGKKLYELARQGITVERKQSKVTVQIEYLFYTYPHLKLRICCSKGTYIRSLAHDIGVKLGCYGHLIELRRTKSGQFSVENAVAQSNLLKNETTLNFLE